MIPDKTNDSGRDPREVTVGLLGASVGTTNLGLAALASGAVAAVYHSCPKARLFFLDYATEPTTYQVMHPGGIANVDLINIRFSKRFYLPNNIGLLILTAVCLKLLPSREWQSRLLERYHVLKAIRNADVIGSLAGGDSFSDIYGLRRLIYVALPQLLVLALGKPLALLPQTYGPFKSLLAKAIARYILRRAKMIYSRDNEGLETVRGLLGEDCGRMDFCPDLGFLLEPGISKERIPAWLVEHDRDVPLVGLNVSGLLHVGGYTRNNMFQLKADYRELIHALIAYFVQEHNAHIMLVPHVFGGMESRESDVVACHQVHDCTKEGLKPHLHLIEEQYDQHEMKALIGRCDFFLGSRMHACIAALSQCVPAVGLAYSPKFRGVFASIGAEDFAVDLRQNDQNAVIALVDQVYQRRTEVHAQLQAKMPAIRARLLDLFSNFHY